MDQPQSEERVERRKVTLIDVLDPEELDSILSLSSKQPSALLEGMKPLIFTPK